jgi:hydrogenase 3 maturation protease
VEFDDKAGSFIIVDKKQVDTFGFSTHTMPISFLINYLEDSVGCEILTMGIQPKDMTLVDTISPEVMESIDELVELIIKNI